MGSPPQIENLTETLQRHLGIQQAQTFAPEDIVADAIARLVRRRGDVTRLRSLWNREDAYALVKDFKPGEHEEALSKLRQILDANLVVQRGRDRLPKSFRPLIPELISNESIGTVFRELGRTVVDVLWRAPEVKSRVMARIGEWRTGHPLALALAPLCTAKEQQEASTSHLGELLRAKEDVPLDTWVNEVVTPDWLAWLDASKHLGVDEQIDTMTALTCLHLHVALLWRLWGRGERAIVFVAVAGQDMDRACQRAAYNMYGYWGERAHWSLLQVAERALEKARRENPDYATLDKAADFSRWAVATIKGGRLANERFMRLVVEKARGNIDDPRRALVEAIVEAFETPSGVATKVKDFLRGTGRAAGLVGPDVYRARKRYQIDDNLLELLVRLHVHRPEGSVRSREDERRGVDALLDDVFARYGLVLTMERPAIRDALKMESLRQIVRLFPGDEAMRRNRSLLERRLDELRLVRRYSDASAVLNVD
jgi:hypothetical protein